MLPESAHVRVDSSLSETGGRPVNSGIPRLRLPGRWSGATRPPGRGRAGRSRVAGSAGSRWGAQPEIAGAAGASLRVKDELGKGGPVMSVYVGIDVHRKRSQVAVVTGDGKVQVNRNVVNGSEPMLRLIGGLPTGTPVAFEAAYGWGWLAGLLEDYGFDPHLVHPLRCKAIASARLKNDKGRRRHPGAAAARRPAARGAGSRRRRSASSAPCCGTGPAWSASAPSCATGSTRWPPTMAMTGPPATGPGRAAGGWPGWTCP